jgi:transposase
MRWVKRYETEGEITGYKRKLIAYKVHKEHIDFLLQKIKRNKTITSSDLPEYETNQISDLEKI